MRFALENGKSFVVKATGVSDRNIYIQSATLNGRPYTKSYLEHGDLIAGGQLVLMMGPQANRVFMKQPPASAAEVKTIPAPLVVAPRTFKTKVAVAVHSLEKGTTLHYTTDNTEPTPQSPRFVKPFVIDRDTTVKALAMDAKGNRSAVVTGSFHRIPHDWKLTLLSSYSSQYTGGGDSALIDGIRGTTNWSGGAWQGYWEQDFVAVVDLGSVQRVSKAGATFLQDVGSWIWLPRRVEIELSTDGKTFTPVASIANDESGATIKDFVQTIAPQNARFVRVRGVNSGKNTWIFVDEILIDN